MRTPSPFSLERILHRMAAMAAPRHRDLAGAMLAELEAIDHPAERRRFARGALAALLRLALRRFAGRAHAPDRFAGMPQDFPDTPIGGARMTGITAGRLLRRHVAPFSITTAVMTGLLLANNAARVLPQLRSREDMPAALLEVLLLSLPSILALTIPMAVFIAVAWVFTRLGREGELHAARRDRAAFRRLVRPVLGVAALISLLTLLSNAQLLPWANGRYTAVLTQRPVARYDRSMTLGELRAAARSARSAAGEEAASRAAAYEVEFQKKLALGAASLMLALAAAAIALRFPRGGVGLVIGSSGVVFTGYYISLIAGEALADRQMLSPLAGMWMANALLAGAVLLLSWRSGWGSGGQRQSLPAGG